MAFFPPEAGTKNIIILYAYARGTGVCSLGSIALKTSSPTQLCPSASPIRDVALKNLGEAGRRVETMKPRYRRVGNDHDKPHRVPRDTEL